MTVDDCPVSYISAQSQELIQIWARNTQMKESCGASLYGPDLRKWPARMVDAFSALEAERARREDVRWQAEQEH